MAYPGTGFDEPFKEIKPKEEQPQETPASVGGSLGSDYKTIPSTSSMYLEPQEREPTYELLGFGNVKRTDILGLEGGKEFMDIVNRNTKGRRGFFESMTDVSLADAPVVGDIVGSLIPIKEMRNVANTFERMERGEEVSRQDALYAHLYLLDMERKEQATLGGKVGDVTRAMPGFGAEIWLYTKAGTAIGSALPEPITTAVGALGGAATGAAKHITTKIGKKLLTKGARKAAQKASKKFLAKVAGTQYASAVHAGVKKLGKVGTTTAALDTAANAALNSVRLMDPLTSRGAEERLIQASLAGDDLSVRSAQMAALADRWIEYYSEASGEMLGAALVKPVASGLSKLSGRTGDLLDMTRNVFGAGGAVMGNKGAGAAARGAARKVGEQGRRGDSIFDAVKSTSAELKSEMRARLAESKGLNIALDWMTGGANPAVAAKNWAKVGYDGWAEEILEERFGDFSRGLLGLEGDTDSNQLADALRNMVPDKERFLVEAISFAIPLGIRMGAEQARRQIRGENVTEYADRFRRYVRSFDPAAHGTVVTGDSGVVISDKGEDMSSLDQVAEDAEYFFDVDNARPEGIAGKMADHAITLFEMLATGQFGGHPRSRRTDARLVDHGKMQMAGVFSAAHKQYRTTREGDPGMTEEKLDKEARSYAKERVKEAAAQMRETLRVKQSILDAAGISANEDLEDSDVIDRLNELSSKEDGPISRLDLGDGMFVWTVRGDNPWLEQANALDVAVSDVIERMRTTNVRGAPLLGEIDLSARKRSQEPANILDIMAHVSLDEEELNEVIANPYSQVGIDLAAGVFGVDVFASATADEKSGADQVVSLAKMVLDSKRSGRIGELFNIPTAENEETAKVILQRAHNGQYRLRGYNPAGVRALQGKRTFNKEADARAELTRLGGELAPRGVERDIIFSRSHIVTTDTAKEMAKQGFIARYEELEPRASKQAAEDLIKKYGAKQLSDGRWAVNIGALNSDEVVIASMGQSGWNLFEDSLENMKKSLFADAGYYNTKEERDFIKNLRDFLLNSAEASEYGDLIDFLKNSDSFEASIKLFGFGALGYHITAGPVSPAMQREISAVRELLPSVPGYGDFLKSMSALLGAAKAGAEGRDIDVDRDVLIDYINPTLLEEVRLNTAEQVAQTAKRVERAVVEPSLADKIEEQELKKKATKKKATEKKATEKKATEKKATDKPVPEGLEGFGEDFDVEAFDAFEAEEATEVEAVDEVLTDIQEDFETAEGERDFAKGRRDFVDKWGWSVPTEAALNVITDAVAGRDVVNPAAGKGLWASLIASKGAQVEASDLSVPSDTFIPVATKDAVTAVSESDADVLLLEWPEFVDMAGFAADTIKAFQGDTIIYIGEAPVTSDMAEFGGSPTISPEASDELNAGWDLVGEHDVLNKFKGVNDKVFVFKRKAVTKKDAKPESQETPAGTGTAAKVLGAQKAAHRAAARRADRAAKKHDDSEEPSASLLTGEDDRFQEAYDRVKANIHADPDNEDYVESQFDLLDDLFDAYQIPASEQEGLFEDVVSGVPMSAAIREQDLDPETQELLHRFDTDFELNEASARVLQDAMSGQRSRKEAVESEAVVNTREELAERAAEAEGADLEHSYASANQQALKTNEDLLHLANFFEAYLGFGMGYTAIQRLVHNEASWAALSKALESESNLQKYIVSKNVSGLEEETALKALLFREDSEALARGEDGIGTDYLADKLRPARNQRFVRHSFPDVTVSPVGGVAKLTLGEPIDVSFSGEMIRIARNRVPILAELPDRIDSLFEDWADIVNTQPTKQGLRLNAVDSFIQLGAGDSAWNSKVFRFLSDLTGMRAVTFERVARTPSGRKALGNMMGHEVDYAFNSRSASGVYKTLYKKSRVMNSRKLRAILHNIMGDVWTEGRDEVRQKNIGSSLGGRVSRFVPHAVAIAPFAMSSDHVVPSVKSKDYKTTYATLVPNNGVLEAIKKYEASFGLEDAGLYVPEINLIQADGTTTQVPASDIYRHEKAYTGFRDAMWEQGYIHVGSLGSKDMPYWVKVPKRSPLSVADSYKKLYNAPNNLWVEQAAHLSPSQVDTWAKQAERGNKSAERKLNFAYFGAAFQQHVSGRLRYYAPGELFEKQVDETGKEVANPLLNTVAESGSLPEGDRAGAIGAVEKLLETRGKRDANTLTGGQVTLEGIGDHMLKANPTRTSGAMRVVRVELGAELGRYFDGQFLFGSDVGKALVSLLGERKAGDSEEAYSLKAQISGVVDGVPTLDKMNGVNINKLYSVNPRTGERVPDGVVERLRNLMDAAGIDVLVPSKNVKVPTLDAIQYFAETGNIVNIVDEATGRVKEVDQDLVDTLRAEENVTESDGTDFHVPQVLARDTKLRAKLVARQILSIMLQAPAQYSDPMYDLMADYMNSVALESGLDSYTELAIDSLSRKFPDFAEALSVGGTSIVSPTSINKTQLLRLIVSKGEFKLLKHLAQNMAQTMVDAGEDVLLDQGYDPADPGMLSAPHGLVTSDGVVKSPTIDVNLKRSRPAVYTVKATGARFKNRDEVAQYARKSFALVLRKAATNKVIERPNEFYKLAVDKDGVIASLPYADLFDSEPVGRPAEANELAYEVRDGVPWVPKYAPVVKLDGEGLPIMSEQELRDAIRFDVVDDGAPTWVLLGSKVLGFRIPAVDYASGSSFRRFNGVGDANSNMTRMSIVQHENAGGDLDGDMTTLMIDFGSYGNDTKGIISRFTRVMHDVYSNPIVASWANQGIEDINQEFDAYGAAAKARAAESKTSPTAINSDEYVLRTLGSARAGIDLIGVVATGGSVLRMMSSTGAYAIGDRVLNIPLQDGSTLSVGRTRADAQRVRTDLDAWERDQIAGQLSTSGPINLNVDDSKKQQVHAMGINATVEAMFAAATAWDVATLATEGAVDKSGERGAAMDRAMELLKVLTSHPLVAEIERRNTRNPLTQKPRTMPKKTNKILAMLQKYIADPKIKQELLAVAKETRAAGELAIAEAQLDYLLNNSLPGALLSLYMLSQDVGNLRTMNDLLRGSIDTTDVGMLGRGLDFVQDNIIAPAEGLLGDTPGSGGIGLDMQDSVIGILEGRAKMLEDALPYMGYAGTPVAKELSAYIAFSSDGHKYLPHVDAALRDTVGALSLKSIIAQHAESNPEWQFSPGFPEFRLRTLKTQYPNNKFLEFIQLDGSTTNGIQMAPMFRGRGGIEVPEPTAEAMRNDFDKLPYETQLEFAAVIYTTYGPAAGARAGSPAPFLGAPKGKFRQTLTQAEKNTHESILVRSGVDFDRPGMLELSLEQSEAVDVFLNNYVRSFAQGDLSPIERRRAALGTLLNTRITKYVPSSKRNDPYADFSEGQFYYEPTAAELSSLEAPETKAEGGPTFAQKLIADKAMRSPRLAALALNDALAEKKEGDDVSASIVTFPTSGAQAVNQASFVHGKVVSGFDRSDLSVKYKDFDEFGRKAKADFLEAYSQSAKNFDVILNGPGSAEAKLSQMVAFADKVSMTKTNIGRAGRFYQEKLVETIRRFAANNELADPYVELPQVGEVAEARPETGDLFTTLPSGVEVVNQDVSASLSAVTAAGLLALSNPRMSGSEAAMKTERVQVMDVNALAAESILTYEDPSRGSVVVYLDKDFPAIGPGIGLFGGQVQKEIERATGMTYAELKAKKRPLTRVEYDNLLDYAARRALAESKGLVKDFDKLNVRKQAALANLAHWSVLKDYKKALAAINKRDFVTAALELRDSSDYRDTRYSGKRKRLTHMSDILRADPAYGNRIPFKFQVAESKAQLIGWHIKEQALELAEADQAAEEEWARKNKTKPRRKYVREAEKELTRIWKGVLKNYRAAETTEQAIEALKDLPKTKGLTPGVIRSLQRYAVKHLRQETTAVERDHRILAHDTPPMSGQPLDADESYNAGELSASLLSTGDTINQQLIGTLGIGAPALYEVLESEKNKMSILLNKAARLSNRLSDMWGLGGSIKKQEKYAGGVLFKSLEAEELDEEELKLMRLVQAAALPIVEAGGVAKLTGLESVITGIDTDNEDSLYSVLPKEIADMLVARKKEVMAQVDAEVKKREAEINEELEEEDEPRELPLNERRKIEAQALKNAGIALFHKAGTRNKWRVRKMVWTVPLVDIESFYEGSSYRRKLKAAGRNMSDMTLGALASRVKEELDNFAKEVNDNASWFASTDGPLIKYRRNYITHYRGPGFLGSEERKAMLALEKNIDAVLSRDVEELGRILALSDALTDRRRGVVPSISDASSEMLRYLFALKGVPFTNKKEALEAVRKDRGGAYSSAGITMGMTYADVAQAIYDEVMTRLLDKQLRIEDRLNERLPLFETRKEVEVLVLENPLALAKTMKDLLSKLNSRGFSGRYFGRKRSNMKTAFEKDGVLMANHGAAELLHRYASDVAVATANRQMLNQMAVITGGEGAPLMIPDPNMEFEADAPGAELLTDSTWDLIAENLGAYFGVSVDKSKSAKQQVSEIVQSKVVGAKGAYTSVESPYPSVRGFYALYRGKGDENILDAMLAGGEVAGVLKEVLGSVWRDPYGVLKAVEGANAVSKLAALQFSVFFPIAGLESLTALSGGKFWTEGHMKALLHVGKAIKAQDPEMLSMMDKFRAIGVTFSDTSHPMELPTGTIDKLVEKSTDEVETRFGKRAAANWRMLASLPSKQTQFIFEGFFNSAKLWSANFLARELEAQAKARGEEFDLARDFGPYVDYLNGEVGGTNWNRLSWATPTMRRNMNLGLFSSNWTIGAARAGGLDLLVGPLLKTGMSPEATQRILTKRWPAMAAYVMILAPAVVQAFAYTVGRIAAPDDDDDKFFIFNNEAGRKLHADITPLLRMTPWYKGDKTGKRRFYIRWGKQAYEIQRWLEKPYSALQSKMSQPARWAYEQATGMSPGGGSWALPYKDMGMAGLIMGKDGDFMGSRLGYTIKKFAPFSILAWAKNPEAAPWQLLGPVSKGTSFYAATQAYMGVLDTWAKADAKHNIYKDPRIKANLEALGSEILEGATRNGYVAKDVIKAARGAVLKDIYAKLYKAIDSGDKVGAERWSRAILRVNGTIRSTQQSMKNRNYLYGKPKKLTEQQKSYLKDAFKNP